MKNETFENPFEDLNPVYRSEEDDIRKGIFSKALRALATSTLEERRKWCIAIHLAQQPAASASSSNKSNNKKKVQKEATVNDIPDSDATTTTITTTTTTLKRSRSPEIEQEAMPEANFTLTEASEYVGAFMRDMLDRVLGLSLEKLSVAQLKVLCLMVGIPETSSRNKNIIYSHLATFYFTHCEKLGKRVSKSTFIDQQAREEAAMLLRAQKDLKGKAGKKEPAKKEMEEKKDKPKKDEKEKLPLVAGKKKSVQTKPKVAATTTTKAKPATVTATLQHKGNFSSSLHTNIFGGGGNSNSNFNFESDNDDDDEEDVPQSEEEVDDALEEEDEDEEDAEDETLHVVHNTNIFQKAGGHQTAGGSNTLTAARAAAEKEEEDPWSPAMLEKRIASIVHLYDPVTTSIVVKKLAQAGYRNDAVQQVVERTLQKFHDRQFIFYDNGIAYLM